MYANGGSFGPQKELERVFVKLSGVVVRGSPNGKTIKCLQKEDYSQPWCVADGCFDEIGVLLDA